MMTGDSLNSCLVAVVAVEPEVLSAWAAAEGIKVIDTELFLTVSLYS